MELEVVSREKNPVLGREEVEFKVSEANVTPSRKELRSKLAALLNAKEEGVIIRFVKQPFGSHEVSGKATVYADEAQARKLEHKYIMNRNLGIKEDKSKKEAPAPEAAPAKKKK